MNNHAIFGNFRVKDIGPKPIGLGDGEVFEVVPVLVTEADKHLSIWVKPFLLGEVDEFVDELPEFHMLVIFGYTTLYAKPVPNLAWA